MPWRMSQCLGGRCNALEAVSFVVVVAMPWRMFRLWWLLQCLGGRFACGGCCNALMVVAMPRRSLPRHRQTPALSVAFPAGDKCEPPAKKAALPSSGTKVKNDPEQIAKIKKRVQRVSEDGKKVNLHIRKAQLSPGIAHRTKAPEHVKIYTSSHPPGLGSQEEKRT